MYNHLKDLVLRATPRPLLDSVTIPTTLSPRIALDRAVSVLYGILGSSHPPPPQNTSEEPVALAPMTTSEAQLPRESGDWETDEMMAALHATLRAKRANSIHGSTIVAPSTTV